MTRDEILAVLEKEPLLNEHGIGLFDNGRVLTKEERAAKLKEDREHLAANEKECTLCCEWLSNKQPIKTINQNHGSYGLKHMVEKATGEYVSNGAFIVAAIHCGFPYRIDDSGPNVAFGISEKSLKAERTGV